MYNWQKSSYSASANACLEVAASWRKSSYSSEGNNCLEAAAVWEKSSHSSSGNACLEIGAAPTAAPCVHLRESDDPGVVLSTSPAQLDALLRAAKSGALRGIGEAGA